MNADTKLDATFRWQARVALDHAVLDLDGTAHRADDAAKLDKAAIAGAVDDPPMMRGDRRINQVAP